MIDLLGLKDWNISFSLEKLDKDSLANMSSECIGRCAVIRLAADRPKDCMDESDIRRSARHEVIHLLLSDLDFIARCRYAQESEVDTANESIVRRLERILTPKE